MAIHKGTELNNVKETWNQNEQNRSTNQSSDALAEKASGVGNNLQQIIEQEASDYDNAARDNRTLAGERATVKDHNTSNDAAS